MRLFLSFRRLLILMALSLMLVSQMACTATRLPPYEATYTVKLRGIKIRGLRKFEEIAPDTYRLSWKAKKMWMELREWSEFKVVDERVIPLSYHYTRKGLGSDRPIHIYFDWDAMQVNASKGDDKTSFPLEPHVVDRLSFQVQLQIDLMENNQLTNAEYRIADFNGLKDYVFSYVLDENIDTRLGKQDTLIFERTKKNGGTKLWISPAQHYLPVKIENIKNGKSNVLEIRSWSNMNKREPIAVSAIDNAPVKNTLDFLPSDDFEEDFDEE